jgi:predicted CXXCH cytochrome family protein
MRLPVLITAGLSLLLASAWARAGEPRLAPLPKDQVAVSVHGPFEQGACETCHERADAQNPGKAQVNNETCLACHDEFGGKNAVRVGKGKSHPAGKETCTACHNPHSSMKKSLLL